MKKITRIIGLMSMVAVMAVGAMSCKKNDTTNASFTFALPTVEGFASGDAKGYVDPVAGQMKWYEGDQMMIYNLDATNPANSVAAAYTAASGCQGQNQTTFSGPSLGAKKTGFFAFYPADKADVSLLASNNRGKWSVDPVQTIDPNIQVGGDPYLNRFLMDPQGVVMAEIADDFMTGSDMVMRHIFGFLNVVVSCGQDGDQRQVKSITIRDKKVSLTGPIELNILEITEERLEALQLLGEQYAAGSINFTTYWGSLQSTLSDMGYTSQPQGHEVTLTSAGNSYVTINNVTKYFIIPLRPGALVDGFDVIVNYADGTTEPTTKAFSGQQYVIRPGWFSNVAVVL
jgi:hypothetical protein